MLADKSKTSKKLIKDFVTKTNWFMKKYDPTCFKFLGSGSFGQVFETCRKQDNQIVALKYIETESDSEFEKAFDEVKLLKRLNHPNILKIFDDCFLTEPLDDDEEEKKPGGGNLYKLIIVSERGREDLHSFLKGKKLKELEILQIFLDIAFALAYTKKKKIFHCDIKPGNILVFEGKRNLNPGLQTHYVADENLYFKLMDWGGASNLERSATFTRIRGDEIGFTKPYASPEILESIEDEEENYEKKFDLYKCDVFSLAMTVLVLCGVPIKDLKKISYAGSFEKDLNAIFKSFISEQFTPLLEGILLKMLHFENSKRLSISEVIDLLQKPSQVSGQLNQPKQLNEYQEKEVKPAFLTPLSIISNTFSSKFPLPIDTEWEKFVNIICDNSEITSQEVRNAMIRVNRKNFVLSEKDAFFDGARSIGWATSISQPSMQAITLQILSPFLISAKKALDIGTGSGYITACMAEIMGPKGIVYSVDHLEEILHYASCSIKKKNSYLLDFIRFVEADGREGLTQYAPYDVIHIGGAVEEMPKIIINQLVEGGLIFAPVGGDKQRIFIWEKEKDGNLKMEGTLEVQYGPLMSLEEHLKRIKASR